MDSALIADFFSTHFDINYLPKKQSPHGGTLGCSENIGCDAYDVERRATFVARFVRGHRLSIQER
jgi:hypothetical protein